MKHGVYGVLRLSAKMMNKNHSVDAILRLLEECDGKKKEMNSDEMNAQMTIIIPKEYSPKPVLMEQLYICINELSDIESLVKHCSSVNHFISNQPYKKGHEIK